MRKISAIPALLLLSCLAACSGDKSPTVAAIMQKNDKYLSCSEVKLEMNEAEFYQKTADRNKSFKAKDLLMPLGYVSTYMNATDAAESSSERVEYLQSIYDIMDCERKERQMLTGPGGFSPDGNGYQPGGYAPAATYAPAGGPHSYNAPISPPVSVVSAPAAQAAQYGKIDENRYPEDRAAANYGEPM